MKSLISIFLICYFSLAALVPRMDMDRLQQIPDLAAHFLEHQKESSKATSLINFINQHYGGDSNQTKEQPDGHQLPFHGHDCNLTANLFASFIAGLKAYTPHTPPLTELADTYTFYLTPQQLSDIWQPPRA